MTPYAFPSSEEDWMIIYTKMKPISLRNPTHIAVKLSRLDPTCPCPFGRRAHTARDPAPCTSTTDGGGAPVGDPVMTSCPIP